MADKGY
jgi:hypothetical protein